MSYYSGFLAAVPTENKHAFIRHARHTATAFKDHGLVNALECWGVDVPDGRLTSMIKAVDCHKDETVIFAFYHWPEKQVYRDAVATSMKDTRLDPSKNHMSFDRERVLWGNFTPLFEIGRQQEGGVYDAFLLPIPKTLRDEYLEFAKSGDAIFLEHGANWCVECWEDDIPRDASYNFHKAVAKTDGEIVVLSWVQWPSKEAREAGNAKLYNDNRLSPQACPFDMSRMIFGSFEPVLATQWDKTSNSP